MNSYLGYAITVTPDFTVEHPRMQLGVAVCEFLTPAMVEDHNAWLREFFGTYVTIENIVPDGEATVDKVNKVVYMNPRTYAAFRNAVPIIGGN